MKKIKFMAMALAVLTIVSCSKEDAQAPGNGVADGKAYASFSVELPSTRADVTEDGTALEEKISDCNVFIFNAAGTFEKNVTVNVASLASEAVEITTGPKTIVTVINGADYGITTFTTVADLDNAILASLENVIKETGATNMLMTSKQYKETVVVTEGAGDSPTTPFIITMNVDRAAAKAFVKAKAGGVSLTEKLEGKATLVGTPQYTFNGLASKVATFQIFDATTLTLIKNHASRLVDFKTADSGLSVDPPFTYTDLLGSDALRTEGSYLLENIAGKATLNRLATMVYIKAQITPTGNFEGTTTAIAEGADYFRMEMKDGSSKFFQTKAAADAYYGDHKDDTTPATAPKSTKVHEHKGGLNYYRVLFRYYTDLDKASPTYFQMLYSVVRNNIYDININNITNWGAANDGEDLVDPDKPIDEAAYIQAKIIVNKWTVKTQNEDLK